MREQLHLVFEYAYRDASNYASNGSLLVMGKISGREIELIENSLEAGEFFVAEQVDVPALYEFLYRDSNGPNGDDHVWHTYVRIRGARQDEVERLPIHGTIAEMAKRFSSISRWNLTLSPHWEFQRTVLVAR